MAYEFTLTALLPAEPAAIYQAWLSSDGHTAMTGGIAHMSAAVDGAFDAWDGYISGRNVELVPDRRIVQRWRTQHFTPDDPDSLIEVTLEATSGGTLLTLRHSNVPDGHTSYEQSGWHDHYFVPMKARFEWLRMNPAG